MQALAQGRLVARLAQGAADVARAQGLRHLAFRGQAAPEARDADRFDAVARHVLVSDATTGAVLCCFRLQTFPGAAIAHSYAAQFYDLSRLAAFPGPMLEMGRFCLHPDCHDPDVLRLAWGMVARIVDAEDVALLFGCSSFAGADAGLHAPALGALRAHLAPAQWAPARRAPEVADLPSSAGDDALRALAAMPALLRTYLGMGAWVSDHAVIDREMDTLHVLTGLEIAAIPPGRARALRLIGGPAVG